MWVCVHVCAGGMGVFFVRAFYIQPGCTFLTCRICSGQIDRGQSLLLMIARKAYRVFCRQMCKEEDRGKERKGRREGRYRQKDEGEGGSGAPRDPSGGVTSEEEECGVDGERVKNKKKNTKGGGQRGVYRSEELSYQVLASRFELQDAIKTIAG